jgi:GH43 family beta-xylosidase
MMMMKNKKMRFLFLGGFSLLLILLLAFSILADSFQATNPLIQKRADPWVYKHTDGYYYFTATVPEYDRIELRRATTIPGLASASATVIWRKHSSGIMGSHIWAPELHYIDGKWYIHFAAGSTSNVWAIRIYVLENTSANPLTGTWVEKGEVQPSVNAFSLDAHYFEHNGTRYLVFAKQDSSVNNESCLFIASMSNPWTYSSTPVRISKPEYSWERAGIPVNEGAATLKRNGKIFIVYSAAKTDASYCMGMLTASDTSNLLSPSSWSKSSTPVFQSSSANSQYGPGHCSFTVSPDGSDEILVYHARNYRDISGDPLNDPNRHTRIQQFTWNSNGTPNFGVPVKDGTVVIGGGSTTPTPTIRANTPTPTRRGATPTPTVPGGTTYYKIRNRATNLCIDGMGRTSNGSNAGQYASGTSYNQQWVLEVAGSYYKIKNRATGLYLDGMGRTSNGSICGQYSGNTSNNQQWTRETAGSYYKFKNRSTGLYLDGMGSTSNGADLCQWGSSTSYNQQWSVVAP